MSKIKISIPGLIQWLASRVGVIYIVVLLFCLTCVDIKMLEMRIKIRHLNDAIPDFSSMIVFSKVQNVKSTVDWKPYKKYFEIILRYMPDDVITMPLLGFVDFYMGQEQKAITLFKNSTVINGQDLFWSNYNLGVIYYKKGMWSQAAPYLLKAIESSPKLNVVLMQDSMVYRQIFTSHFFNYSLSNEMMNAQSDAYILLLSSLHEMRQYDKMIIISNLGLANPSLTRKDAFYYYAGLAFFELGQMEKAYLLFEKSLTIEKNNPDVYYYMASIFKAAGQIQQAQNFLQASYVLHQKNDERFPYDKQMNLRFF